MPKYHYHFFKSWNNLKCPTSSVLCMYMILLRWVRSTVVALTQAVGGSLRLVVVEEEVLQDDGYVPRHGRAQALVEEPVEPLGHTKFARWYLEGFGFFFSICRNSFRLGLSLSPSRREKEGREQQMGFRHRTKLCLRNRMAKHLSSFVQNST